MKRPGIILPLGLLGLLAGIWLCYQPAPQSVPSSPKTLAQPIAPVSPQLEVPRQDSFSVQNDTGTNAAAPASDSQQLHKLTAAQVAAYLAANKRNAESLIAAFRVTDDQAFLREAMKKFPNDPKVAFNALSLAKDLSPEEHRQWLEAFKQAAPDNALANYLSARDYLKSGQTEQALQEFNAGAAKPGWQDYSMDFMQNAEEAYRAAGYSTMDARTYSSQELLLPHLWELKQAGVGLSEIANSYRQSGDTGSAQAVLEMDANFGHQFISQNSPILITTLVGMAIEKIALSGMDPASPYGDSGITVKDRIDQIAQQRADIRDVADQYTPLKGSMSEDDRFSFFERRNTFGAIPAMQWVINKYGQP